MITKDGDWGEYKIGESKIFSHTMKKCFIFSQCKMNKLENNSYLNFFVCYCWAPLSIIIIITLSTHIYKPKQVNNTPSFVPLLVHAFL